MYRLHYAPDNASLIVRLVLDAHGLPYELALVDRTIGAQHSDAYRAINPAGVIPALETPQGTLFETGAILLWLGDRHGLVPAPDHADRGVVLGWLFFLSNTVHADLIALFYPERYGPPDAIEASRTLLVLRLKRHLALLDRAAADRPDLFDQSGILAPYLLTLIRWCALYPEAAPRWLRLADTPALSELAARFEALPATQRTAAAEPLGPNPFTDPVDASAAQSD